MSPTQKPSVDRNEASYEVGRPNVLARLPKLALALFLLFGANFVAWQPPSMPYGIEPPPPQGRKLVAKALSWGVVSLLFVLGVSRNLHALFRPPYLRLSRKGIALRCWERVGWGSGLLWPTYRFEECFIPWSDYVSCRTFTYQLNQVTFWRSLIIVSRFLSQDQIKQSMELAEKSRELGIESDTSLLPAVAMIPFEREIGWDNFRGGVTRLQEEILDFIAMESRRSRREQAAMEMTAVQPSDSSVAVADSIHDAEGTEAAVPMAEVIDEATTPSTADPAEFQRRRWEQPLRLYRANNDMLVANVVAAWLLYVLIVFAFFPQLHRAAEGARSAARTGRWDGSSPASCRAARVILTRGRWRRWQTCSTARSSFAPG